MSRLVLIDGHAILHRAFHAYPPLTTSKGELVGAVYGFTNILLTVLARLHPEFVACAFDKKGPTFRHKKFAEYKAHRPPMEESLSSQIPRVHQIVESLNIPIFEVAGYEADDVIGTLACKAKVPKVKSQKSKFKNTNKNLKPETPLECSKSEPREHLGGGQMDSPEVKELASESSRSERENIEIIIVTGDQDVLQLVDDNVKVHMPSRGKQPEKIYDRIAVLEKYGLEPGQLVDLKALAGDVSDEIPGVKGVGPKTTKDLLARFSTVEGVYKHLDDLPKTLVEKLEKGKNEAFLSKELAKIDLDVPIKLSLPACRLTDYQKKKVLSLFEELEFKSLIKKLPKDSWEEMVEETMIGGKEEQESKQKSKGKQMGLF